MLGYHLLNYFFIGSHVLIIGFTLFGWISQRTRKAHLGLVLLTVFSWLVLGIWFGYGYCFWTDWHWQVRQKLGYEKLPNSFVKFLADRITGVDWDPSLVDRLTEICLYVVLILSLSTNWMDYLRRRGKAFAGH